MIGILAASRARTNGCASFRILGHQLKCVLPFSQQNYDYSRTLDDAASSNRDDQVSASLACRVSGLGHSRIRAVFINAIEKTRIAGTACGGDSLQQVGAVRHSMPTNHKGPPRAVAAEFMLKISERVDSAVDPRRITGGAKRTELCSSHLFPGAVLSSLNPAG